VSKLKNSDQDPKTWITYLEGLRMKLKDLGSTMTDEDIIVHILNNLTDDYNVQLSKLEEKLGSTTNLLIVSSRHLRTCKVVIISINPMFVKDSWSQDS